MRVLFFFNTRDRILKYSFKTRICFPKCPTRMEPLCYIVAWMNELIYMNHWANRDCSSSNHLYSDEYSQCDFYEVQTKKINKINIILYSFPLVDVWLESLHRTVFYRCTSNCLQECGDHTRTYLLYTQYFGLIDARVIIFQKSNTHPPTYRPFFPSKIPNFYYIIHSVSSTTTSRDINARTIIQ